MYFLFLPLLLSVVAGCGDEEYHYPSVKLEYLTAYSNADGVIEQVRTDDGEMHRVLQTTTATAVTPDSVLRIVTNYEPLTAADGTAGVKLYAWANAISPFPQTADEFEKGVEREPAEVASIWMGYEYLNLLLEVKQQGKHVIRFVEEGVTTDAEGHTTVAISLYHAVSSEVQDYTKRAYLSVPLSPYLTPQVQKLTVSFSLVNNAGEEQCYELDYYPH